VPLASLIGNAGDQIGSTKLYLTAAHHGDPTAIGMVANNYKQDYLFKGHINGALALAWYRLAERRGDTTSIETYRANIIWISHALSKEEGHESDRIFNDLLKTIPINPGYPRGFDKKWLSLFDKGED